MAASSSQVLIGLQVNLKGLVKLDQLNAALRQLKTNLTAWQRAQSSANTTFGKFSQTTSEAAKNMKALQQANAALATANARLAASQSRVATGTEKLTAAQRETIRLRREEIRLDNLKIRSSDNLATRLRKVETAYDSIYRAGFRLQMLGNDMEQLGRRTIESLAGMANEFGDFEFMINRAAGAMGIMREETDRGANVYDRFQKSILDAANELRLFQPEEVAKATYYWASTSGQQVDTLEDMERALKAVNPLMKIAALTQTDYQTTIKGVYSILIQYGKGIEDVGDVVEKLNKVTVETAAEFPDLINSFKMVGPVAAANNVTFEDMVELFGKLADAGIRGTMSGRAFRQLFIQLVKPSELAKAALDNLWASTKQFGGKSYTEMVFPKGEYVGVTKYVNLLAVALKDLNTNQKNALLARITTANELPVLTALVNREITAIRTNSDAWSKGAAVQRSAAEIFATQWEMLSDSWNGLVGALTRGVETVRILIGKRLAEVFGPVIEEITEHLTKLSDWFANEQNGPMIDFILKITGAVGGFLAVAGFATKLAGALTILGAAIMVVTQAFGPLLAKVTVFGGVLAALATAVQRNFDYIKEAVISAFNDISEAFGGAEGGIQGATDAFKEFAAATRPIFDFLVRTIADVVRSFGSLVKILMGFEPTRGIIEALGKGLIFIFGARMIANVTGLTKVINLSTNALRSFAVAGAFTNFHLEQTVTKVGRMRGAFNSVKGVANNFFRSVGVGGALVMGAAIAGLLYEFTPLGDAIDNIAEKFKDMKKASEDALAQLGEWRQGFETAMSRDAEYIAVLASLEAAKRRVAEIDLMGGSGYDRAAAQEEAERLERVFNGMAAEMTARWAAMHADIAKSGDQTLQEFTQWGIKAADAFEIKDLDRAGKVASIYFGAINKAAKSGTNQIDELTQAYNDNVYAMTNPISGKKITLDQFLDFSLGPQGKIQAKIDKQTANLIKMYENTFATSGHGGNAAARSDLMMKLLDIRDTASPELGQKISKLLEESIKQGLILDDEVLEAAGEEVVKTTSSALISAFEGLKDFDKQIAAAMKKNLDPSNAVSQMFKSFVTGQIGKGFVDADGDTNYAARLFASEQVDNTAAAWQMAFDQMSPLKQTKFIEQTIRDFNTHVGDAIPETAPVELRQDMQEFMTSVYSAAGMPVPPEILEKIWGSSFKAGQMIPVGVEAGVEDPATVKNLNNAVTNLRDNTTEKMDFGSRTYGYGQSFIQKFLNGIQSVDIAAILRRVTGAIAAFFKFSEPKTGPLRGMRQSGQHMVGNFLSGMEDMREKAVLTSNHIADAISMNSTSNFAPQGVSIESSNRRLIKVQIEVTSPDGSVDRVKTAQLTQAMQNSDLILALEHMSTVG